MSAALKPQGVQGPDFTLENRNGFAHFYPHTERAEAWARNFFSDDDSVPFPADYAPQVLAQLVSDGYSVASAAV
jgi:hypothetical protein